MIKTEAIDEMLISKAELEQKLFYLEAVLKQPLAKNTRRGAEAQKIILQVELCEVNEMLEAEYEEMTMASVMMDIFLIPGSKPIAVPSVALPMHANSIKQPQRTSFFAKIKSLIKK